jgi:hypothetical protein
MRHQNSPVGFAVIKQQFKAQWLRSLLKQASKIKITNQTKVQPTQPHLTPPHQITHQITTSNQIFLLLILG